MWGQICQSHQCASGGFQCSAVTFPAHFFGYYDSEDATETKPDMCNVDSSTASCCNWYARFMSGNLIHDLGGD